MIPSTTSVRTRYLAHTRTAWKATFEQIRLIVNAFGGLAAHDVIMILNAIETYRHRLFHHANSAPQDMRHIAIAPKQYYPDVELALAYEWKDQMDTSSALINPRAVPQQDIVVEISVPVVVSTQRMMHSLLVHHPSSRTDLNNGAVADSAALLVNTVVVGHLKRLSNLACGGLETFNRRMADGTLMAIRATASLVERKPAQDRLALMAMFLPPVAHYGLLCRRL